VPADSPARRAIKRALAPLAGGGLYARLQALSIARDIRAGSFREPEIDLVPLAVRPGETALDLGANFGMWVAPLSAAVGDSGRVWAFEPIPFTVSTLRTVIRLLRLGNVELVAAGCSEQAGAVEFALPVQASGALSAGQAHSAARDDDREGRERHARLAERDQGVVCEVVAIDDVVPAEAEVSFIKADIEGAEPLAFRGAARTIAAHLPTIVCEINPWFLEGFGFTVDDLLGDLTALGYELRRYSAGRLELVAPAAVVEDNYVLVHPSRRSRLEALM
jgi:FkbM family methyltransferase